MKRIFTLLFCTLFFSMSQAQLVLNEVYTLPNTGKSEFFELYNTNGASEPTDNYTLVTYYRFSTTNKGFYVLDLPAASVSSKGFYVGSAANPFNYQGVTNSSNTNFNWNDATYLVNNNGSLRQWKLSSVDLSDGNPGYDEVPIGTNLNDLFSKLSGGGASYLVFLYKNGNLVNSLLAGTGGSNTMPSEILTLPSLNIDMSGASPDFTIDFSTYGSVPIETVTEEAGSDNGYIRTNDGACGSWTKSSSGSSHTPMVTNGGTISTTGSISITASIIRGNATSGSTVTYSITTAPATMMPVQVVIYLDNGTTPGVWDAADTYLTTDVLTTANVTSQYTFMPFDADIVIVAKAASGCIDHARVIPNVAELVLDVNILNFKAYCSGKKPVLEWTVAENEKAKSYEIQKSTDGIHFTSLDNLTANDKSGFESYSYKLNEDLFATQYFRIKIYEKNNSYSFSRTLILKDSDTKGNTLTLLQNPVGSTLNFNYSSTASNISSINIYNTTGVKICTLKVNMQKGLNTMIVNLDSKIIPGTYILEVMNNEERSVAKLIKQ